MRAGAVMSTQRPPPRRFELFFFSLPQAPLLALSLALIVFLPPHFATHLDMPLEQVSALFLAARLLDLGLGPALGHVQDATRLRFGRRRVWLAAVAPLLMLLAWLGSWRGSPSPDLKARAVRLGRKWWCLGSMPRLAR